MFIPPICEQSHAFCATRQPGGTAAPECSHRSGLACRPMKLPAPNVAVAIAAAIPAVVIAAVVIAVAAVGAVASAAKAAAVVIGKPRLAPGGHRQEQKDRGEGQEERLPHVRSPCVVEPVWVCHPSLLEPAAPLATGRFRSRGVWMVCRFIALASA